MRIIARVSFDELTWTLRSGRARIAACDREKRWVQAGWLLDELRFVWRDAHDEATAAYEHWRQTVSSEAYAVYVAARDRADAAEDALSAWHAQHR